MVCVGEAVKRTMYQRKVDVDMLADVSSVSPSSEQSGFLLYPIFSFSPLLLFSLSLSIFFPSFLLFLHQYINPSFHSSFLPQYLSPSIRPSIYLSILPCFLPSFHPFLSPFFLLDGALTRLSLLHSCCLPLWVLTSIVFRHQY